MNRRQKKKAQRRMIKKAEEMMLTSMQAVIEAAQGMAKAVQNAGRALVIWERVTTWSIEEALEAEKIMERAYPMPEGTDKSLLTYKGVAKDKDGWVYSVYYDKENDEYFTEVIGKGMKKEPCGKTEEKGQ